MNKIYDNLAKVFSVLFNPFLMPTFGILLIFMSGTYLSAIPFDGQRIIVLVIFAGTFLLPLSFLPLLLYFKVIDNINISDRSQRIVPLIITGILYYCTFYLIRRMPIPFINIFLFGSIICIALNAIIVGWWKISSHLIGVGGLVGLAIGLIFRLNADMPVLLMTCILIAGFVGSARLHLKAHNPMQVYAGFFLGLSVICGLILFM
jgi:membrane-associated phospholipid phosphatase